MEDVRQDALLHAAEDRERDYSSFSNDALLGYVFSPDGAWHVEADREMHRRLVAGRADLLAGRASDAWGALIVKIVTLMVRSSSQYARDLKDSSHEIAELVSEFCLQLANRDAWMTYDGSGKLASYLVNKNGPLLAALKLVKDPRRKTSPEVIKTVLTDDITMMEERSDERPEGEPETDAAALKNFNAILLDYQAKMTGALASPERDDLKKVSQILFRRVAKADPDGARAYCMFYFGRESINVGKFSDEEYQQMLMGSCGLKDRVIARLMHKSVQAVTQARHRFQMKMRSCGEAFLRREELGAATGGLVRVKGSN